MLKAPNKKGPMGLRNKTIMSPMLYCGLRLSETTNLKPGSINLTKGKIRIKIGKGSKDRDLAIPDYLISLLEDRRKKRPESVFSFQS